MICTDQPYNENDDIRITKSGCYDYTFYNKSICPQTVTVTRLTSGSTPYTEVLTVQGLSSVTVNLPGDGIYSVTGVNASTPCLYLTVTATQNLTLDAMHVAVFDFTDRVGADSITIVRDTVQAINAYDSGIDGASTLTAPANLLTALTAYGTGTGVQYVVQLAAPGVAFSAGWNTIYASTTNYRLLVAYVGTEIDRVTVAGQNYGPVVNACVYFANGVTPGFDYVTQVTVGGIPLMTSPQFYDVSVQAGQDSVVSLVMGALATVGTAYDAPGPDEFGAVIVPVGTTCPEVVIQFAEGTTAQHDIAWCTTLFELCQLWNCLQTKLAEWLCCNDPCNKTCEVKPTGAEWIDQVSLLTIWGMMPLITEHRIWQYGDFSDDYGSNLVRLQPTILLWDRWYKLVNGCGCPTANGCSPCEGGGLTIPQSPIIQPVGRNTGGCGCGC